ncbi:MAG: hypothetical protein V3S23_07140 [Kiloniellales bacterium]
MTINSPPLNGPFAGVANAVEVIVDRPVPSFLSAIIFDGQTIVTGRAVASSATADACIWALNPSVSCVVRRRSIFCIP